MSSSGILRQLFTEFLRICHGTNDTSPHDIPPIMLSFSISTLVSFPASILFKTQSAFFGSTIIIFGILLKYRATPAITPEAIPPTPACKNICVI